MLADKGVEAAGGLGRLCVRDVTLGTSRAVGAVAGLEGSADGSIGRQSDLVGSLEEGGEAEVVLVGRVVEDL